jgi:hypothetical protein
MKRILLISSCLFMASCVNTRSRQERFCIVVQEVRYTKHGKALIKPKCKEEFKKTHYHRLPWYRYPTSNIHIGDTVDVSLSDIAAPSF